MDEKLCVDQQCINIEQKWYESRQIIYEMTEDVIDKTLCGCS